MTSIACTIVSANYIAYAATLRDSLQSTDPGLPFKVLIVDERSNEALTHIQHLQLDVIWLQMLQITDWRRLAFRYNILELNTNVKPVFLRHLLDLGFDRVIYCDPDTYYFSSVVRALAPAEGRSIALTPHLLTIGGTIAEELIVQQTGVFNLGFIAVTDGPDTRQFLDWWSNRCMQAGFDDVATGQYVDQKWVNLVPALFPNHAVLRSPALNVAYWNLHERNLRRIEDVVFVDDEPLVFFHFSGIARTTSELSRHRSVARSTSTDVALSLASAYRAAIEAHGHSKINDIPYAFDRFDDGSPILPIHRMALQHLDGEVIDADPFRSSGDFAHRLRNSALWPRNRRAASFRPESKEKERRKNQERTIGKLLTLLARFIGPARYWYLCKYLSLRISPLMQRTEVLALVGRDASQSPRK